MLTALLLTSMSLAPVASIQAVQSEPPVRVWVNKTGDLKRGDRVKVYARTETDGYLLILHAEADGRIRVLFPLDPYQDNFVRGQSDFEVRGRGDREAFRIYHDAGLGTVYAAFSRDPFQFGEFVRDDHWDFRLLETWQITEGLDAETELTALVRHMTPNSRFDYDLVNYFVGEAYASGGGGGGGGWSVGIGLGFGWGWGGWGVGVGWGWGGWGWGWGWPGWGWGWGGWGWAGWGWGWGWGWGPAWGWGWGWPRYACCGYWYGYPHHGYGYYGGHYGGRYGYGYGYAPYGYYGTNRYGHERWGLASYTFKPGQHSRFGSGGLGVWGRDRGAAGSRYTGTPTGTARRSAPSSGQLSRRTSRQAHHTHRCTDHGTAHANHAGEHRAARIAHRRAVHRHPGCTCRPGDYRAPSTAGRLGHHRRQPHCEDAEPLRGTPGNADGTLGRG
jgi:hypothetical protein